MAKQIRRNPPGQLPQPANDGAGAAHRPGLELKDLAVPAFDNLAGHIESQTELVDHNFQNLTLENAELLMKQVQCAQRNLTESLNQLSRYRKAVARVLETRRREKAQAARAANPGQTPLGATAPFPDASTLTDGQDRNPEGT